jgi:hypothetical protein
LLLTETETETENKRNEEKRVAIYAMGHILNKRKTCSRNFEKRKKMALDKEKAIPIVPQVSLLNELIQFSFFCSLPSFHVQPTKKPEHSLLLLLLQKFLIYFNSKAALIV